MSDEARNLDTESDRNTLWTADDAAKYLRVSRDWVYKYSVCGVLPAHYVGALLRFSPEEVRAWALNAANTNGKIVRLSEHRQRKGLRGPAPRGPISTPPKPKRGA